jgi:PPOX class probable F420-dependent enzyme
MSAVVERVADLQYRFLDRIRDRRAHTATTERAGASDFESLRDARQCLVVSFKRDGEPVPTPVIFGFAGEEALVFRADARSAKVRRLRRNPRARVCACSLRGKPTGPVVDCSARIVPDAEVEPAERAVASNWSPPIRVVERGLDLLPIEMSYVELRPVITPEEGPA